MNLASRMDNEHNQLALQWLVNACQDRNVAANIYQISRVAANGPTAASFAMFLMELAKHCITLFGRSEDPVHLEKALGLITVAKDAIGSTGGARRQAELSKIYDMEGQVYSRRFERFGSVRDLEKANIAAGAALESADGDDLGIKARLLNSLGCLLRDRFMRLGNVADIENSISNLRLAVDLTSDRHIDKPVWLGNLGLSLLKRFEASQSMADMSNAILRLQQAVDIMPDEHASKPSLLNNLGIALLTRYEQFDDIGDLTNAITVHEKSVELAPNSHNEKPGLLSNLGNSLLARFRQLGHGKDLEEAIIRHQQAVDLRPDGHPDKPSAMHNLSHSLDARFERIGDPIDLNSSILLIQRALALTPDGHPSRPAQLNQLGLYLRTRFERLGDTADIDDAVMKHQQAVVSTPDGHISKSSLLYNLGQSLTARFEWLGDINDINNAILKFQQAVDLTPDAYSDKSSKLNDLGTALCRRFQRLGDIVDIDNAILKIQLALHFTPPGHTTRPGWLCNLGNALLKRFQRLGDTSDINDAISRYQQAIDLPLSNGQPVKRILMNNLGNSLREKFERLGDMEDINKSILTFQKAIEITPDGHPDKPAWLSNLGNALVARSKRQVDGTADIEDAILKHQQALDLTPDGHPDRPFWLNNLGISSHERFKKSGNEADIDNSILRHQQSLDLIPDGHLERASWLYNLGIALHSRFKSLGEPGDRVRLISSFREAALSPRGHLSPRWAAARNWANLLHPQLEPYHAVIALIPQIVWLGRTIEQRYKDLEVLGRAVMDAVAAACETGAYDLALEWIEQGRAIIWAQILRLRSPMDGLQATHPELANEVLQVAGALEMASNRKSNVGEKTQSPEKVAQEHRRLAERWEFLLKKVQELPEFTGFLQHKAATELKKAATNGTIVIVNVSRRRCDALILLPSSATVDHLHLSTLSLEKISAAHDRLYKTLRKSGVRVRDLERGSSQREAQSTIPNVLQMLWTDVARPILDHLGYCVPSPATTENLPQIAWCLTGPLATLPLHAAGKYDDAGGDEKLFNYVVSSYIPSLTSLIAGKENTPLALDKRSLLAVTQQDTPTLTPLPGTMREVNQVKTLTEQHGIRFTRMDGSQATVKNVSVAMNSHSWIHLSCHGQQNGIEPTKSAFFFHDGALELAEIMTKPLKHAELAYLSACQTASGDTKLPDEAIHLAAGMFIAGYRSVIGTLWSIRDADAPLVAGEFYDRLLRSPDGGVARALHEAVAALRERVGENNFVSWVPYIHIGH